MATYRITDITKTLKKLFKNKINTTEKLLNIRWQDLDSIGEFTPFEKSLIMDFKVVVDENYKTNRRNIKNGIVEFLAGNNGKEE